MKKKKRSTAKASKIPYIFFAFFGVIISVNLVYIYVAQKTWRGTTTDESYQKGLDYNAVLEQKEKQESLGWQVELKPINMGNSTMLFTLNLLDKNSFAITDADISIMFKRPTQDGFDFSVPADTSHETYSFKVKFPLKGQWDAVIFVSRGEDKLYLSKRYIVK